MDWKIELVNIPVSDVDRAKAFYVGQVGFNADHDHTVNDRIRFVQLTPPGSACSIAIGTGLGSDAAPGSVQGMQMTVADVEAARAHLVAGGVDASEVQTFRWGRFVFFGDPDGKRWSVMEAMGHDAGDSAVLAREVGRRGGARLNGRPAAPGQLKDLGRTLVGIHGQHDHRLLTDPEAQTLLLDTFAGAMPARDAVAAAH